MWARCPDCGEPMRVQRARFGNETQAAGRCGRPRKARIGGYFGDGWELKCRSIRVFELDETAENPDDLAPLNRGSTTDPQWQKSEQS